MIKLTTKTIDDIFLLDSEYNVGLHNLLLTSVSNLFFLDFADLLNSDLLRDVCDFKPLGYSVEYINDQKKIVFYLSDVDMNFIINEYLGGVFYGN